jgi:hypothetical protein
MIRSLFYGRERLAFTASDSSVESCTEKCDSLNSFCLPPFPSSCANCTFAATPPPLIVCLTSFRRELRHHLVCSEAEEVATCAHETHAKQSGWNHKILYIPPCWYCIQYTCPAVGRDTTSESEVCNNHLMTTDVATFFSVAVGGAFVGRQIIWPTVSLDGDVAVRLSVQFDLRRLFKCSSLTVSLHTLQCNRSAYHLHKHICSWSGSCVVAAIITRGTGICLHGLPSVLLSILFKACQAHQLPAPR